MQMHLLLQGIKETLQAKTHLNRRSMFSDEQPQPQQIEGRAMTHPFGCCLYHAPLCV